MEHLRQQLIDDQLLESLYPLDAYTLLTGRRASARVAQRVRLFLERDWRKARQRRQRRQRGWVYCFRALDEPNTDLVKIGYTRQSPRQRVAQWATQLQQSTILLFAYESARPYFAEQLVHRVLTAERAPPSDSQINPTTGDLLTENFLAQPSLWILKVLVRNTLRYVDEHCCTASNDINSINYTV